jgi:WD40 repeat protein
VQASRSQTPMGPPGRSWRRTAPVGSCGPRSPPTEQGSRTRPEVPSTSSTLQRVDPPGWQTGTTLSGSTTRRSSSRHDSSGSALRIRPPPAHSRPCPPSDGTRIAYATSEGGTVHSVDVQSGDDSMLARLPGSTDMIEGIDWSPDGLHLAIVAGGSYMVNADGSGLRVVDSRIARGYPASHPDPSPATAWSPDGTRLAYADFSGLGDRRLGIWTVSTDRRGPHPWSSRTRIPSAVSRAAPRPGHPTDRISRSLFRLITSRRRSGIWRSTPTEREIPTRSARSCISAGVVAGTSAAATGDGVRARGVRYPARSCVPRA